MCRKKKPGKKILKLKKRKTSDYSLLKDSWGSLPKENNLEQSPQRPNKQVRFEGIIESIDRLSQAGEEIENSTGDSILDTNTESSVRLSVPKQGKLPIQF